LASVTDDYGHITEQVIGQTDSGETVMIGVSALVQDTRGRG
jgi:hypothetical protein